MREFIADTEDEAKWEVSFEQTHERLIASAQKAKQEIAQGKSRMRRLAKCTLCF